MSGGGSSARQRAIVVAALAGIGLAAAAVVLIATPWGLGQGGDSYYYVSGARSITAGEGFARPAADGTVRPITHFPPLYSLVLAGAGAAGLDVMSAGRAFHAVLFGANGLLLGWLVWRGTRSLWLAAAGSLLFSTSPAMISVHSWLLSEALFLFLVLASAAWMAQALETGRRPALIAAGIAAGLAALTRYAGLALVLSHVVVLLWRPGRRRWVDAGITIGLGSFGWLVWAARNAWVAGSLTNRGLSLHLPEAERLTEAVTTVARWLLPGRLPLGLGATAVLALAVIVLVAAARRLISRRAAAPDRAEALLTVSMTFVCVYAFMLAASLSFADASTPLDDRILSPLFVFGLVVLLTVLEPLARRDGLPRGLAMAAIGGMAILMLLRGGSKVIQLRQDGQGYTSRAWRESAVVDWVAELDAATAIYSNELDALYLLTGRQAYQVPIRWDPVREAERDDYPEQLTTMRGDILTRGAVLVLFDTIDGQQAFFPPRQVLTQGLTEVVRADDGAVYGAGP